MPRTGKDKRPPVRGTGKKKPAGGKRKPGIGLQQKKRDSGGELWIVD